jgi:hypothetical protein
MKLIHGLLTMAGILAVAGTTRAESVTVNLGASSQNFVETGISDNGFGEAQWFITQGACAVSGGDTGCTLTGNYTGSTAGYTSGTYSLVTTYAGTGPTYSTPFGPPYTNGPSPLLGISVAKGSSDFEFEYLDPSTTIMLYLDQTGGADSLVPIFEDGFFVNHYGLSIANTPACTGVGSVACNPFNVGETNGATITSLDTGSATFEDFTVSTLPPPKVPEPSSLTLLCAGAVGLLFAARRK